MNFNTPSPKEPHVGTSFIKYKSQFEEDFCGWEMPNTFKEASYKKFIPSLDEALIRMKLLGQNTWDPKNPKTRHAFALLAACKSAAREVISESMIEGLVLINCLPNAQGQMTSMDQFHHTDVFLGIQKHPNRSFNGEYVGLLACFDLVSAVGQVKTSGSIILPERNYFDILFSRGKQSEIKSQVSSYWKDLQPSS